MQISRLPEELRELLYAEMKKQNRTEVSDNVNLSLTWNKSSQGQSFWDKVNSARKLEELPEPYNQVIIPSYEIF